MKKIVALIIAAVFLISGLAACGSGSAPAPAAGSGTQDAAGTEEKLQIVTTIFPIYDWVEHILGDNAIHAEVSMLLDNGVDLHSYQPTAEDILKISSCDLFIYVGGESDAWVEDALETAVNPDMAVIDLLDVLGDSVKEEELKEGMQESEHEHEHGEEDAEEDEEHEHSDEDAHEEGEEHEHEHEEGEVEYDEHVWLSLKNAQILCSAIEQQLETIDQDCAELYQNNLKAYMSELEALDAEYTAAVEAAPVKTLLFGDRFPFRYMTDDYGLDYYAAFVGCSAETEASFETITFLAGKVDELSLHAVMTIEGPDKRIAETIVQTTKTKDQEILTLDSMQSVTAKAVQEGTSYLSIMQSNLEVLKEALK